MVLFAERLSDYTPPVSDDSTAAKREDSDEKGDNSSDIENSPWFITPQ